MNPLTSTQKKVFCAISAFPDDNDRQLAERLGMKRGTIASVRKVLEEQKLFTLSLVPDPRALNLSFLGLKYGDYGKIKPIEYHRRMSLMTQDMKIAETLFSLSSPYRGLSVFYGKEFYPLQEQLESWNSLFESIDTTVVIRDYFAAPQAVRSYKFLETHPLLAQVLEVPAFSLPPLSSSLSSSRILRNKERQLLVAWLQESQASHLELSQKTGLSRSVVGTMKKRFLRQGIVRQLLLPSWVDLGIHLGVFLHIQVHPPQLSWVKELSLRPEIVFLLASSYHLFLLALYPDYDAYQRSALSLELKKAKLVREPREILFPLQDTHFHLQGASVAERVLQKV